MTFQRNHELKDSDEHYTPKWIFDALNLEFDLDVSAPKGGISWLPAKRHYSIEDDGLAQAWSGLIWMNPPYSKPTPWVHKFIEHNNGIALLLFSKSKWFDELWNKSDLIMPLKPGVKFERPDGLSKQISFPSCLFGMGEIAENAMLNSGINKCR